MTKDKNSRLRKAGDALEAIGLTGLIGLGGLGAGAAAGGLASVPINGVIDGLTGDDVGAGAGDTVKNLGIGTSVGAMVGATAGRHLGDRYRGGMYGAAFGAGAGAVLSAAQALMTNRATRADAELVEAAAADEGMTSQEMLGGLVAAGLLTDETYDSYRRPRA